MKHARSRQNTDAFEAQTVFSAYSIKRPNYFQGQLLSAEDFITEQRYHLEKQRRHNRCCHGVGIVQGLEVSRTRDEFGWTVVIQPGMALDSAGNEIEICHRVQIPLRVAVKALQVGIRYVERKSDAVPAVGPAERQSVRFTAVSDRGRF